MSEQDKSGKDAYGFKDSKIVKGFIIAVREEKWLNMGSDRHGKVMPRKVFYRIRDKQVNDIWIDSKKVVFDKSKIHELIG